MTRISESNSLKKGNHGDTTLSDNAVIKSKDASSVTEPKLRTKSALIPWNRRYHHGHNRFHPYPAYYTRPPHPNYYHPYYYHYPILPRSHHPRQLPTASLPNDHSFSPTTKTSKASPALHTATRKIDTNATKSKDNSSEASVRKQTEGPNATISSKQDGVDKLKTESCFRSDAVPNPLIPQQPAVNVEPIDKSTKRSSSPTKSSSPVSTSSDTLSIKEKVTTGQVKGTIATRPRKDNLMTDVLSDNASKISCSEWPKVEVEQLAGVFNPDMKMESCDCLIARTQKLPKVNEVTDPVDLMLIASAKFVTFKNIGAGLDSNGNLSQKQKPGINSNSAQKVPKKKNRGKKGGCPDIDLSNTMDTHPNSSFASKGSNFEERVNGVHITTSSSNSTGSDDGKSGHGVSDPIVIANNEITESPFPAIETSEKLFDCTSSDQMRKGKIHGRFKEDMQVLADDFANTEDLIYDTNPPFPIDSVTENTQLQSGGSGKKAPVRVLKDDGVVVASGLESIFRKPSLDECYHNEEVIPIFCKSNANDMDDTTAEPVDDVENTNEDICLDSYIRSLISEDEEDSLIRPSRGFSPTTTLLLPAVVERSISL